MNRFIFVPAVCVSFSPLARATDCSYSSFSYKNIYWDYCQNVSSSSDIQTLLRKGEAILLDEYIGHLIDEKKLPPKKFQVTTGTLFGGAYITLDQNKNFFSINGDNFDPGLEEMVTIINYFTSPSWKALYAGDKPNDEAYEAIMKTRPKPDMGFFRDKERTAYTTCSTTDSAKVVYLNGNIVCWFGQRKITLLHYYCKPQMMHERLILFSTDTAFVYTDSSVTAFTGYTDDKYSLTGFYWFECYSKWAAFYDGSPDPILSYDYEKNKFQLVKKKKED